MMSIVDLEGPVHYADFGGDGPPLVLVHGLGGSHLNWISVAGAFTADYHVLAPDLAGFGLTPPGERGVTVTGNAELLADFIATVCDTPAVLVANSMGGLVSLIAASNNPGLVTRLILVNPALPIVSLRRIGAEALFMLGGPLIPLLGEYLMRGFSLTHTPEEQTTATLTLIAADPSRLSDEQRQSSVEMTRLRREMDWAIPSFVAADRSVAAKLLRRRRYRSMLHRVAAPPLLIHGDADRLVDPASAEWAAQERPDWDFIMLEGVGHVPMMEVPDRFVAVVETWLNGTPVGGDH